MTVSRPIRYLTRSLMSLKIYKNRTRNISRSSFDRIGISLT